MVLRGDIIDYNVTADYAFVINKCKIFKVRGLKNNIHKTYE